MLNENREETAKASSRSKRVYNYVNVLLCRYPTWVTKVLV